MCRNRGQPTVDTHHDVKTLLAESFGETTGSTKKIYDLWFSLHINKSHPFVG